MKQLIQNLRTGKGQVLDVPAPRPGPNDIIVRNRASVISSGTERMVLEFSQRNLLSKAMSRPEVVRQILNKAKRDGVLNTLDAVGSRLDQPMALGYSSAGEVTAVGAAVTEFQIGDRVACAGGGFAVHAEAVRIPRTLAARVNVSPERSGSASITFEEAAFAAIGSVALHAVRLASPQLGETVAVIGLGVVGLLAVQFARAAGCRVVGIDPHVSRCRLAERLGCDRTTSDTTEFEAVAAKMSEGIGADSVLIAAATESSQPLELGARIARHRASIIAIGSTGTELPRRLFYEKELDFKVSRSYGPGRYDFDYEEKGHDYPLEYVRWTEGRNLGAFLNLLAQKKVEVAPLISHRFPISSAQQAYETVADRNLHSLGVVIEYPSDYQLPERPLAVHVESSASRREPAVRVGLLGAGNYVKSTLLPVLRDSRCVEMVTVCAASGISAAYIANKGRFRFATSDPAHIFTNSEINTVVIATRHHLHASQIIAALQQGKHVFCEKPLCLNDAELREIIAAYRAASVGSEPMLMVGFNRRFAPLSMELKRFLGNVSEPLVMNYRVNAGPIPRSHWIQDREQGGCRIIGESCHFIDLMTFLCDSNAVEVFAAATPDVGKYRSDNAILHIKFANGSAGVITYVANGSELFPKERLEIFSQGRTAVLNDFRSLELVSAADRRKLRSGLRPDKGHRAAWNTFADSMLQGNAAPIPFAEIVSTTVATFRLMDSLQNGKPELCELKSPPIEDF